MYRDPGEDPISFGDIFQSDHLVDVFAAGDTRSLGGGPMPRTAAEKVAKAVSRALKGEGTGALLPVYSTSLELTETLEPEVRVYSPTIEQHADRNHALAHASNIKLDAPTRAILLTDSCAVDTALVAEGRSGRRKRGRLLFAPVVPPAQEGDVAQLIDQPVFSRFPLARCTTFPQGAIAELRYCFNVDVNEVRASDRILALTDEASEDLEVAWAAQTLRRGPLSTERNVGRLTARLGERGYEDLVDAAGPIGETVDIGWLLESELDASSDESLELTDETIEKLDSVLGRLEDAARGARERLRRREK